MLHAPSGAPRLMPTNVSHEDRARLKRYLQPRPSWPWVLFGGGLLGLALAIALHAKLGPIALTSLLICFGLGALFFCYGRIGSAGEFDLIAESDFVRAEQLARECFQVSPGALRYSEACRLRHARKPRDVGKAFKASRIGRDEKRRFTPHEITVVLFGEDQLLVFECTLDLTTGLALNETTHEVAYEDIVSVDATLEKETHAVGRSLADREIVRLWKALGIEPINDILQLDGDQTLSLRLGNGEPLLLAKWRGHAARVPSGEGRRSKQASQRLRKLLLATKLGRRQRGSAVS
jgi:hypothetical protein